MYNVAGIHPSATELAEAISKRLPDAHFTYNPDPIRTAIVESWPHDIDDSAARKDWDWQPNWSLERMTEQILGLLGSELASQ